MAKLASLVQNLKAVIRLARASSQGFTREESASRLKCSFTQSSHLVDSGPGRLLIKGCPKFLSVWVLTGQLTRWQLA